MSCNDRSASVTAWHFITTGQNQHGKSPDAPLAPHAELKASSSAIKNPRLKRARIYSPSGPHGKATPTPCKDEAPKKMCRSNSRVTAEWPPSMVLSMLTRSVASAIHMSVWHSRGPNCLILTCQTQDFFWFSAFKTAPGTKSSRYMQRSNVRPC